MADNKNTPKPKPSVKPEAPKALKDIDFEAPAIYDAIVDDVVVEEEEVVVVAATPAYTEKAKAPASAYAVVSGNDVDTVFASKIIAHNKMNKKSLSVHHLQRRLNEWGYTEAFLDVDGYCGDRTISAISEFQKDKGLEVTGVADFATLQAIFEGDTNVHVAH